MMYKEVTGLQRKAYRQIGPVLGCYDKEVKTQHCSQERTGDATVCVCVYVADPTLLESKHHSGPRPPLTTSPVVRWVRSGGGRSFTVWFRSRTLPLHVGLTRILWPPGAYKGPLGFPNVARARGSPSNHVGLQQTSHEP
ncbi:hypothetical protein CBL_06265 [Carabus blaptoides fortunei]